MSPAAKLSILLLALLVPGSSAHADRGETYVMLGYEPGLSNYKLGGTGTGTATRPVGLGFSAAVYRGLTNTWHIGGRLHLVNSTDVHVGNALVEMQGGSASQGDVYQDHRALALGATLLYRVDTHSRLAPVLEIEGGLTRHEYTRVAFIPAGATRTYPQPSRTNTGLYAAAALVLEYRLATRWAVSAGLAGQAENSGDIRWSIRTPVRLGVIW